MIQSLSVGLLYVEEETVHSVHRFTMFWSLKRHWLHKIGNQAWGHSLTVSTKQRSVAAATKWPVWAVSRAGARWAEEVICHQDRSKFNRWTNTLQSPGRAQYCDADSLSTVLFCHARFSLVTLLPSPLSPSAPFLAGAFSICDSTLQASCLALFLSRLVDWKLQPRRPDDYVSGSPPTTLCAPH